MRYLTVGRLADHLNVKTVVLLVLAVSATVAFLGYRAAGRTSEGCVRCHSDKPRLQKLNASWAYVTNEAVRRESRHGTIQCRDCHLGNGGSDDKVIAHKGMLKMLVVSDEGTLLTRSEGYPYGLSETGDDRMNVFMPKVKVGGAWVPLPARNILWHDRSPATFDFDPGIVAETCGKSGCHTEELKQFSKSDMGTNHRQRTMKTWLAPYGPHNCGPSFADKAPPESQNNPGFDYANTRDIAKELSVPFDREQARDKQKFCNVCHAGCLDCHYTPMRAEKTGKKVSPGGVHTFIKVPSAESCSGYGRSNSICHPGAMHSRRGETYIGGDYSVPGGMAPDVHYKKGLGCVTCHLTGEGGMGHMERKASCGDCHLEIEEAMSRDVHRNMDCATCHIGELRGYQITAWGPGLVAGRKNPFNKYSLYYGIQSPPILIRDQKGKWMPVKVWPHTLGNVRPDVPSSGSMQFRWPDGQTRDAYYVIGTASLSAKEGVPNSRQLLWLEIEQAAHPYGPSRTCLSCHGGAAQISVSKWKFEDNQGAEPFTGGYRIVADDRGLRIEDMETTSPVKVLPGYTLTDFAPWLFLKDKWKMPGDFSIKTDREKYIGYNSLSERVRKEVRLLDARSASFDHQTLRRYKIIRAFALHNPEEGLKRLAADFLREGSITSQAGSTRTSAGAPRGR
jgi:hypothetical protein